MILEVKNIYFQYKKEKMNLKDVSFNLSKGEIVSILGANGAGKSTLFKLIMGILKPFKGEIKINGKSLSDYSLKEVAREIGYVRQYNENILNIL